MRHPEQGPHAAAAPQSGAPVQPSLTLPRLPSRGRLVTGQPEPALFAWVMDSNDGVDEPVPFWPTEVHP